jgi:hypothetical protein
MTRPRTPTQILEVKGSFLRHPERKRARVNEPRPTGELGDAPEDLSKEEKTAWRYLASLLAPGVAKNMDRAAMEEAATLRVICKSGQATAAERQLYRNYLAAFGMTPADRSRVHVEPADARKDDPWSRLLASSRRRDQFETG